MCSFFLTGFTGLPERIHLHYCKRLRVRKTEISESGQLQLLLLSEIEKIRKKKVQNKFWSIQVLALNLMFGRSKMTSQNEQKKMLLNKRNWGLD